MRVLVACEYSGIVRDAFIAKGHDAMSCDLLPTESHGPHYHGDVFNIIDDGWDMMIAHPPCTYLTVSAEWAYKDNQTKNMRPETLTGSDRMEAREDAIIFFMSLYNADIKRIAVENPVGVMSTRFRKPDQWIQPYEYGHDASKKTGLWLKGLEPLFPTKFIEARYVQGKRGMLPRWENQTDGGQNRIPPSADRWKLRSTTYQGIADAMAAQWG